MQLYSKETTALLTGSTAGIGAAIAESLIAFGVGCIVINGRDRERGEEALRRLARGPGRPAVRFVEGDMSDEHDAARLVHETRVAFGRIDVFVHCVGSDISAKPFLDISPDVYQYMTNGHLLSLFRCCGHVVPLMAEQKSGVILTVASDAAKVATPGETIIGALKAAVAMFTRTLALEVSRFNIRANCLTPSIVQGTLSYDRLMSDDFSRKLFTKAESRARLGVVTPSDIGPLAAFLASPLASKITGQTISINGGISAA